ncbi:MAG: hypothetical protein LGB58_07785 [Sulfurovum sp.]|nr:hypothetical protein [Sulfurovum sp.]
MRLHYVSIVALSIALLLTGCSSSLWKPFPFTKEQRFLHAMVKVAKDIKSNPKYHKMVLRTPAKKLWLRNLMYKLWDKQITRKQFIAKGIAKYPKRKYEFTYIADAYEKNKFTFQKWIGSLIPVSLKP